MKYLLTVFLFLSLSTFAQNDTIVLRDIDPNAVAPATMNELNIPSANCLLQGFIYKANGAGKHPTLFLLHGYPGNERNLDLAQIVRNRGWNVIYFDYRGSWASQGKFSFMNCVEDVVNVVKYCKANADKMQIDTTNMALFGHSMGGFVCLKSLQRLPEIKKGFALSTWNIANDVKNAKDNNSIAKLKEENSYFVLNTPPQQLFEPVIKNLKAYDLANDAAELSGKTIVMIDEHNFNKPIAEALKLNKDIKIHYEVWQTDHPFTNKRVALAKTVLNFLQQ